MSRRLPPDRRALLTPDEVMQLRSPVKDASDAIIVPDDMLGMR